MTPHYVRENERLKTRLALIAGTEHMQHMRRFRRDLNKLSNILQRNTKYETKRDPVTGLPMRGNRAYRAYDEAELCHAELDRLGVASGREYINEASAPTMERVFHAKRKYRRDKQRHDHEYA